MAAARGIRGCGIARAGGRAAELRFSVGDARDLPFDDDGADAVLLLGPLYHLVEREDRVLALREGTGSR
ncbi:class I SAM-dependent methyltransferase [Saccharopolyspora sp. NPDC050389]|uniref:class I SAM-dependent methyltransferase n=1 Tax=Saccharopolyspora sp. NPDC050389 TaxID=3155516 RepID=UPI00340AC7C0